MPETQTWLDEIPQSLGRYEIIKRLAVGGMAELFLARVSGIQGFEKYVAIKRILPHHAEDSHFVDMFLDEARLAARLDHQNIVQVHDIGHEDGAYFFSMEYLHGVDLQEFLKTASHNSRFIPLEQTLTIVAGVAAGLEYAHEKCASDGRPLNIVHRDVAPSNIIVTYDGGVKLVDFGIARAKFRQSHTEVGRVKGKLSYMSPEQCRGEKLDGRSDIFSLGIVMYELTTMSRLFRVQRGQKLAVMERIVSGRVPPPSSRAPDYPPDLERIVMRALHGSRDKRYQSAGELLFDLEHFAKQRRLSLSAAALARCLRDTVGYRPEPWREDGSQPGVAEGHRPSGGSGDAPVSVAGSDGDGVPSLASLAERAAAPPTTLDTPPVGSLRATSRVATHERRLATAESRSTSEAEIATFYRRRRARRYLGVAAAALVVLALIVVSQLGPEATGSAASDPVDPISAATAAHAVPTDDQDRGETGESKDRATDRATSKSAKRKRSRKSSRKRRASAAPEPSRVAGGTSNDRSGTGKPGPSGRSRGTATAASPGDAARDPAADEVETGKDAAEGEGRSQGKARSRAKDEDKDESRSVDKDKDNDKNQDKERDAVEQSSGSRDCNWDPNSPLPPSANRCRKN